MSLALASLAIAIARPSTTLAASSSTHEELPSPLRVAFLVALLGQGEIMNCSFPPLELSLEVIPS
jgi:hypothetical protein